LGKIADLVNKLDPYRLSPDEHHELATLLDSLSGIQNTLVHWGFPGGVIQEGPGIDITGSKRIGVGHDSILLVDSSANVSAREYAVSSAGFDAALTAASSGDVILLPAQDISGNHTITAGVKVVGYSRYATQLTGQITMAASASIENLSIIRTADDSSAYVALINQASGTSYAHSCDIKVEQSGSGNAYGVSLNGAGNLELWNCYTYGSTAGAYGYAVYDNSGGGNIILFGGRAYGSTDEFG